MQLKKFLFFLFIITLLPIYVPAQTADAIVERYVAFIGGKKGWSKVKTLTTSGEYNYGGIKFPFMAYAKAPNHYKFLVPFEGKYYAQAFDGKQGWKIDAFKNETSPTILTGQAAVLMANEADVELEDAFIDYQRKGHKAMVVGQETVQGKNCIHLKFVRADGNTENYYFDEATSAIVMKTASSKNAELQGTVLNIMYSDYRDVNGIKIPFKTQSKSGDQMILEVTIDKAEINRKISDSEFAAPD
jgi:hypothetical protein